MARHVGMPADDRSWVPSGKKMQGYEVSQQSIVFVVCEDLWPEAGFYLPEISA